MRWIMLLACLVAGPASAQTAEEMVAYLAFGLRDKATIVYDNGQRNVWTRTGASPATFEGSTTDATYAGRFVIRQERPCVFVTTREFTGQRFVSRSMFDFKRIDRITLDQDRSRFEGAGVCTGRPEPPLGECPSNGAGSHTFSIESEAMSPKQFELYVRMLTTELCPK